MDHNKAEVIERFIKAVSLHGMNLVYETNNEHCDVQGSTMDFLSLNQQNIEVANYFNHRLQQVCCLENPSNMETRLSGAKVEPAFQERINKFIASKSDLLFTMKGREELRRGIDYGLDSNHEVLDLYSKVPPLEVFMGIPVHVKRWQLLKVIREGDIVLGEVISKRPFGIFVKLIALEFSKNRDFTDTNIEALCRSIDLDNKDCHREHKDPTDAFLIGDYVRGVVSSVNLEEERIAISFKSSKLPEQHQHLHLGLLEDMDRTKPRSSDHSDGKSYTEHLTSHVGLNNPRNIETLIDILGVNTKAPCSLLRSFQRCEYPKEEYFDTLRKKQSAKWSMESTAKGIELFKAGQANTAMKYLEHALQIDGENVEALVARGALSANEGKYDSAVSDFRRALSINDNHKNATKYLVQTLIEHGIQQENNGQLTEACHCLNEALKLNPDQPTAKNHLEKVKQLVAIQRLKEERDLHKQESKGLKSKFSHVRQLIEEEQIRKKKKKKKDEKKRKRRVGKTKKTRRKKTRHRMRPSSDDNSTVSNSSSSYQSDTRSNKTMKGESSKGNEKSQKHDSSPNIDHKTIRKLSLKDEQWHDDKAEEPIKKHVESQAFFAKKSHELADNEMAHRKRSRSRSIRSRSSSFSDDKYLRSRKRSRSPSVLKSHQGKHFRRPRSGSSNKSSDRSTHRLEKRSRDRSRSRTLSRRDKRSGSGSDNSPRSSSYRSTCRRRSHERSWSRSLSRRDKRSSSGSDNSPRSFSYRSTCRRRSRDRLRSRPRDKRSRSNSGSDNSLNIASYRSGQRLKRRLRDR